MSGRAGESRKLSVLTMAAFALCLSVIAFLLFRAVLSFLAAIVVPVVIVMFDRTDHRRYYLLMTAGLILFSFLFFRTQLVFVIGYLLLSLAMRSALLTPDMNIKITPLRVSLYALLVSLALFICIRLTELVFSVPLHGMMLRMSGSNPFIYLLILLIEGLLVSGGSILLLTASRARIRAWKHS